MNPAWLEEAVEDNRKMFVMTHLIWKAQVEVRPVQTRRLDRATLQLLHFGLSASSSALAPAVQQRHSSDSLFATVKWREPQEPAEEGGCLWVSLSVTDN